MYGLRNIFSLPRKIRARFDEMLLTQRDAVAMAALAPLGGTFLPITGYSMRPSGILALVNDVVINRRRTIVEFGPGLSTIYLARLLRSLGDGGRITSFDHDAGWLDVLQRQLAAESLAEFVTLVHAPLVAGDWGMGPAEWYDESLVKKAVPNAIDLLVVDGPIASDHVRRHARFPAIPVLRDRLGTRATVVLDDINRSGELDVVGRWSEQLGVRFELRRTLGRLAMARIGEGHAI